LPLCFADAAALCLGHFILIGEEAGRLGIIEELEKTTLEKGTEWLTVRGHEAKAILAKKSLYTTSRKEHPTA